MVSGDVVQAPFHTSQIEHAQAGERSVRRRSGYSCFGKPVRWPSRCSQFACRGELEETGPLRGVRRRLWAHLRECATGHSPPSVAASGAEHRGDMSRGGARCAVPADRPPAVYGVGRATPHAHAERYFISRGLFQPNPHSQSARVTPGLEALTALFHQLGLPVMSAARWPWCSRAARAGPSALRCRRALDRNPRTGGLAVAVYAVSSQFILFNSHVRVSDAGVTAGAGRGCIHCPRALGLIIRARYCRRHGLSACRRRDPSRHQFLSRGVPGYLDCCAA